ncbi:MAG: single-stranded-DNA-specific exonuclease RecJ [Phycisphaeraceae bacterium]|nr:single-stranded-DNA-specific exonuclease RecJ [Phycisphaeraceae bacterium]
MSGPNNAGNPTGVYGRAGGAPVRVEASPAEIGRGIRARWRWRLGAAPTGATLLQRILAARGLADEAATLAFLEPRLSALHDPSLIPDLDRAAERLLAAIRRGEQIAIYGDYDVDGVTATAILWHMIRAIDPGAKVRSYVPHRLEEGYGLNVEAIRALAAEGAGLIVSVDCGVTATEPAEAARACGADLIITDHHNPPKTLDELPRAYAVVHPCRPDSAYPFPHLCGAGVAYKLAWRLATLAEGNGGRASAAHRALLLDLLAFAALGAIADVVPLVGENRVIARFGLERVRRSPVEGLRALVEQARLDDAKKISTWDVGFKLGPRLNAIGRLGHAREAVELFTTAIGERAAAIARALEAANAERQAMEREIFEQACFAAEAAGMTGPDRRAIVLADERWHKGVVGIVCSRLVEKYSRPAILMQRLGGSCQGSGRSIDGFNLHGALEGCAPLLERFGGHDMAAGLSVNDANLDAFVEAFTERANAAIRLEDLVGRLDVDAPATVNELSLPFVKTLERLEPCGRGNPSVAVLIENAVVGSAQSMGAQGAHLRLTLGQGARPLSCVAWRRGEWVSLLATGVRVDAVVRPTINEYGGTQSVQGEVLDLRIRPAGRG